MIGAVRPGSALSERSWDTIIISISCAVLLITIWCLSQGITTIFMHLYYIPIILLAYHYRKKGLYLSILLSLSYFALVAAYTPDHLFAIEGAGIRSIIFIGVAALVAYLSEQLVQAREALGRTAHIQEGIIQNANVWLMVLDSRGRILEWNTAAEEMSGFTADEVIGKNEVWKQLYPDKNYRKEITGKITEIVTQDNYLENLKTIITGRDGTKKTIMWNTRALPQDETGTTRYIAIGVDVTSAMNAEIELQKANSRLMANEEELREQYEDLARSQKAIHESEAEFKNILRTAMDGFCIVGPTGSFLDVNDAFCTITGYTRDELLTLSLPDIEALESVKEIPRHMEGIIRKGADRFETQYRRKDGEIIDVEVSVVLSETPARHFITFHHNITNRNRAEKALRKSEVQFRMLAEQSKDIICTIDLNESITFISPAVKKILGYEPAEVVGKNAFNFIFGDDRQKGLTAFKSQVVEKGQVQIVTVNLVRKDGNYVPVEFTLAPVYKEGKIAEVLVSGRDITERKQAEAALKESEEQYRTLFSSSRDAIMTIEPPDWRFTSANPATVAMFMAKDEAELLSTWPWQVSPERQPDGRLSAEKAKENIGKAVKEGSNFFEWTHRRLNGEDFPATVLATRFEWKGQFIVQGTVRDITEQKRAEAALKESEEKFHGVAERSSDIIQLTDRNGRITYVSPSIKRILGFDPEEVVGTLPDDIVHPEDLGAVHEFIRKNMAGSVDVEGMETRVRKKGGSYATLEVLISPVITNGILSGMQVMGRDITERKKAEMERDRLVSLIRHSSELISLATLDRKIIFINDAGAEMLGVLTEDAIGQDFIQFVPDYLKENLQTVVLPALMKNGNWEGDLQYRNAKTGNLIDVRAMTFVIGDPVTGAPRFLATVSLDITGRKQAENNLRESERRLTLAIEGSDIGIWDWDVPTGRVDYNDRQVVMLGYKPDEFGNDVNRFMQGIHPDDLPGFSAMLNDCINGTSSMFSREIRIRHKDTMWVWVLARGSVAERDMNGKAARISGTHLDITDRKKAEEALKKYSETLEGMVAERTKELTEAQEQLVKKEKLAVLGKLAGGVGHELRNPLGAIKNATYFLNMVLENPEPDVKETLDIMNKEVTRSENILSSLLDFARPTVLTLRKVRINDVLSEAVTRNPIPENITLTRNPDDPLPDIMADPDKLLQVFTNLITNACQAMPTGGSLTLTLMSPDENHVSVSVTDTGVGISEENMKRLFEPLFSTKAKGIGLGLVVTKSIVEAHQGNIDIRSETGKGTTFTVTLPVGIEGGAVT